MSEASLSSSFPIVDPNEDRQTPPAATTKSEMAKNIKDGAVHAKSAWLDLLGSVTKVVSLTEEAPKSQSGVLTMRV